MGQREDTAFSPNGAAPCVNSAITAEAIIAGLRIVRQCRSGVAVILQADVEHRHRKRTLCGVGRRIGCLTGDRGYANRES
jgi:hypothetical protein